jgi:hypothetical protein
MNALLLHRIHFAFTITYHYLFPQLTMGLALLIVVLKTLALRSHDEHAAQAARFWAKIFAVNFLLGVVTGIPMEFQFGTNWSEFSRRTGSIIGQPLAMEGVFSFFLESTFSASFSSEKNACLAGPTGPRPAWYGLAPGSQVSSLLLPMPGCSTLSRTACCRTALLNSQASGNFF